MWGLWMRRSSYTLIIPPIALGDDVVIRAEATPKFPKGINPAGWQHNVIKAA